MKKQRNNYAIVFDCNGVRLHNTRNFAHVRHLIKDGKAKIINQKPFTIMLNKSVPSANAIFGTVQGIPYTIKQGWNP